jgi:zinc and cadmium transporter
VATLLWIIGSGLAMCLASLVGGFSLLLSERAQRDLVLPMVALAAGALLGGALFHMLPAGVEAMGVGSTVWAWTVVGFVSFFVLEQFLHWHHCHRPVHDRHAPQTWLLLLADGLHNLLGGLAVGGAFIQDTRWASSPSWRPSPTRSLRNSGTTESSSGAAGPGPSR